MSSSTLRLALIGKTGNGKSSTGNSILRSNNFETGACADGVTDRIQSCSSSFQNYNFKLLDTPGVLDPNKSDNDITNELKKIIDYLDPGPHAFFIVLRVGRFTDEDNYSVKILGDIFGEHFFDHSIIIFTGIDHLKSQNLDQNIRSTKNEKLLEIIAKCNNRYIGFNNLVDHDSLENKNQVKRLFEMIEGMTSPNFSNHFKSKIFDYSSQNIEKRKEAIQNSPSLTLSQKANEIEKITSEVSNFFSQLAGIISSFKLLISSLKLLCNIV